MTIIPGLLGEFGVPLGHVPLLVRCHRRRASQATAKAAPSKWTVGHRPGFAQADGKIPLVVLVQKLWSVEKIQRDGAVRCLTPANARKRSRKRNAAADRRLWAVSGLTPSSPVPSLPCCA